MTTLEATTPVTLPEEPAAVTLRQEPAAPAVPGEPQPWKWTGEELVRLGERGFLPPDGRFELLDGVIYQLMPPGPLHAYLVDLIGKRLQEWAPGWGGHAREEKPIRLGPGFDPQPDVAVVRGPGSNYRTRFPSPEEVVLLVEVADSSVEHDRTKKVPAYAEAGIPECWLVNLPEQQIEVYTEPVEGVYRVRRLYRSGETIAPLAASGIEWSVSELVGEPPSAEAEPEA